MFPDNLTDAIGQKAYQIPRELFKQYLYENLDLAFDVHKSLFNGAEILLLKEYYVNGKNLSEIKKEHDFSIVASARLLIKAVHKLRLSKVINTIIGSIQCSQNIQK